MNNIEDTNILNEDLVILAKFAINGSEEDIRLFLARLVRKYRTVNSELSENLSKLLNKGYERRNGVLRSTTRKDQLRENESVILSDCPSFLHGPIKYENPIVPILSPELQKQLIRTVKEHKESLKLEKAGLRPSSSMVFVGRPGVGKTLTAHWLANELDLPLFTIDFATIMSSYLGQTGNNLKSALDYARQRPMVLLLDEIDALAKKRNDDTDIGEIKRIVTVLLQEIEYWFSSSLLIAATNHPELVDTALWRRFDHIFSFDLPSRDLIIKAIKTYFKDDYKYFEQYETILTILFEKLSFSDIERSILEFRRAYTIGTGTPSDIITETIKNINDKKLRLVLAKELLKHTNWSQYKIHKLTGVSRDTLRKYKEII